MKSHRKPGEGQGRLVAQKLRQKHTCRHPVVGFVEKVHQLPLLLFREETGLCCIDVLEGPAWQTTWNQREAFRDCQGALGYLVTVHSLHARWAVSSKGAGLVAGATAARARAEAVRLRALKVALHEPAM